MKKKLLIIDSTFLLYTTIHSCKESDDFSLYKEEFDIRLESILNEIQPDYYLLAGDGGITFRKKKFPKYKEKRAQVRPKFINDLKNYIIEKYNYLIVPLLEADDIVSLCVQGVLKDVLEKEGYEISYYSVDKDSKTVSGQSYYPKDPKYISKEEAFYNLCIQTLKGDPTDDIPGLKGCGNKCAEELLTDIKHRIATPKGYKSYEEVLLERVIYIYTHKLLRKQGKFSVKELLPIEQIFKNLKVFQETYEMVRLLKTKEDLEMYNITIDNQLILNSINKYEKGTTEDTEEFFLY